MNHLYVNPAARGYQSPNGQPTGVVEFHRKFFPGYPPTRLVSLPTLAEELGVSQVLLKDESSRFGLPAFKILGASWAICTFLAQKYSIGLSDVKDFESLRKALVDAGGGEEQLCTATEGNHGRAVARIASLLGLNATVFVPETVSQATQDLIESEGNTTVVPIEEDYDAAIDWASEEAEMLGLIFAQDTPHFGHVQIPKLIVEGYSTLFAEVDEQLASLDLHPSMVVVPVGVGSLAHSAVLHYRSRAPQGLSLLTVEPDTAACLNASLHASRPVSVNTGHTIMAGLNCGTVSAAAWPELKAGVDMSTMVNDAQVEKAIADLAELGVNAGPCGAAPLAALRQLPSGTLSEDMVVVVICTEGSLKDSTNQGDLVNGLVTPNE